MKFKAAVVQDSPVVFNLEATINKIDKLVKKACGKGAKLIVFPEAFVSSYPKGMDFGARIGSRTDAGRKDFLKYYNSSLDFNSREFKRILGIAKKNKVFLVVGVIEKAQGTLYCTVVHISDKGKYLGKHRKIMPTASERLVWGFGDGSTLDAYKTSIGTLGSVICWENYMPMLRMTMYNQNVQLYCAPTADDRKSWISSMKHIALEGRCFVLSACQLLLRKDCPKDYSVNIKDPKSYLMKGGSCIVSPLGEVLAGPDYKEKKILYANIDLDEIIKGKYDFDVVGHYSRPDIFKLMVDKKNKSPVD